MKSVIECLATLRAQFMPNVVVDNFSLTSLITNCGSPSGNASSSGHLSQLPGEERQKLVSNSDFQHGLSNPVMSEPSVALKNQAGQKYHEVFELKPGRFEDLSLSKSSEMMKTNCLDRTTCMLRKVVQEIESRISTQAEHLRTQNNSFKALEEKYWSSIGVIEALASGTSEKGQVASLNETIAKKDGEIEPLQLLKDLKNVHPDINGEKRGTPQQSQKRTGGKGFVTEKSASDHDNRSELKHSEADSQQSMDDLKCQNELLRQSKVTGGDIGADGSAENAEGRKLSDHLEKPKLVSKVARAIQKAGQTALTTVSMSKDSVKMPSSR